MSQPFVWFHNSSKSAERATTFYKEFLGWTPTDSPPGMTLFAGEQGPFAAVGENLGVHGWVPYVEVEDVDEATRSAEDLGAKIVKSRLRCSAN